jgi:hypothetical protein
VIYFYLDKVDSILAGRRRKASPSAVAEPTVGEHSPLGAPAE